MRINISKSEQSKRIFIFMTLLWGIMNQHLWAQNIAPDDVEAAETLLQEKRNAVFSRGQIPQEVQLREMIELGLWKEAGNILDTLPRPKLKEDLLSIELDILLNRFEEAEQKVINLSRKYPGNTQLTIFRAKLYVEAWELRKARNLCNRVLRSSPSNKDAAILRGNLYIYAKRYQEALAYAKRLQKRFPEFAPAYLLEANALFWLRDLEKAEEPLKKCLELDPLHADARFAYGYAIWRKRDASQLSDMAAQWRLALDIHPLHYLTHWHWGNGHTHLTYEDYVDPNEERIIQAEAHISEVHTSDGVFAASAACDSLQRLYPNSVLPSMLKGSLWYLAKEESALDTAQMVFQRILDRKENFGPAHNGLAAVIKKKRFQFLSDYDSLAASYKNVVIKDSAALYATFHDLSQYEGDRVPKMVWQQLYAGVAYLPFLQKLERKFSIPPLHIDLARAMNDTYFRGATTFDNRQWMDIRGVGSGATGIEYLERGGHLERNVLLHEYVHLFHGNVFSDAEIRKVRELYFHAMENDLTLDYYAANNEYEYLAQIYPAYFLAKKVHPLNHKSINTRRDLQRKDPLAYAFIDSLVNEQKKYLAGDQSAMRDNWAEVYVKKSNTPNLLQAMRLAYLDSALVWNEAYLPALLQKARIYTREKNFEAAQTWIEKAKDVQFDYAPIFLAEAELIQQKFIAGNLSRFVAMNQIELLFKQAEIHETDLYVREQVNERMRKMYLGFGKLNEAIATAERYAQDAPTFSTYLKDRKNDAEAFVNYWRGKMGYPEASITYFDSLITQFPQNYDFRRQYAEVLIANGFYEKAIYLIELGQKILRASKNPNPDFDLLIVQAFFEAGEKEKAGILMENYLQEFRSQGNIHRRIRLMAQLGHVIEAKKDFGRMTPLGNDWKKAEYFFTKSVLEEMSGNEQGKLRALYTCFTTNPYYIEAGMGLISSLGDQESIKQVANKLHALEVPPGPTFEEMVLAKIE